MNLRFAKTAPKRCHFAGTQILFTEHQHRVLGESGLDPGEGLVVERLRQIDAERLGAERLSKRAKFSGCGHRALPPDPSVFALEAGANSDGGLAAMLNRCVD